MAQFDITAMTLGEIDRVETLSGLSVSAMDNDDKPKGKLLAALAFVAKRRAQLAAGEAPSFTWNDCLALSMDEANELLGFNAPEDADDEDPEAAEDPTDPEG